MIKNPLLSILLLSTLFFTSCLQRGVIQFDPKKDEVITTEKIKSFMKDNPNPSIVLRVPSSEQQTTQSNPSNHNYIYNTVEKELVKAGFDVKDRGLFNEVIQKSSNIDYDKVREITGVELILELVRVDQSLNFNTNRVYKGEKEIILDNYNIKKYGAAIEFKLVIVEKNEYGGSYSFYHTPCEAYVPDCRCYIGYKAGGARVYPNVSFCERISDRPYEVSEENILEELVRNGVQQVISELRYN